jgi:hypothetical protein
MSSTVARQNPMYSGWFQQPVPVGLPYTVIVATFEKFTILPPLAVRIGNWNR